MMGLALMAWRLAGERVEGFGPDFTGLWEPSSRAEVESCPDANPCSAEYYRICDRIIAREKP